jgi:hypothetical protein
MPRLQVYLPDDLYRYVKRNGMSPSELLQQAVRAQIDRQEKIATLDRDLAKLRSAVGKPSTADRKWAKAVATRVKQHLHAAARRAGWPLPALVVDSGGVSRLAERSPRAIELLTALRREGCWPPLVPSVVLVECLTGHAGRDANTHRLLRSCTVATELPEFLARRAAWLRTAARRGSAVDAIVVASAEPEGVVLTSDIGDLGALATNARGVAIQRA